MVQVKPLSKPKKQKGDKVTNENEKRKEIDQRSKEDDTTQIIANEEDLVLDDKDGDNCKETTGNQIERNVVREKSKHNHTKTKQIKRKQSKETQDKMASANRANANLVRRDQSQKDKSE